MKFNKMKKIWIRLACIFVIIVVMMAAYFGWMSWKVMSVWRSSHGQQSDCMIVLGAAVWDGKPSPALRERLDIAVKAYKDKLTDHLILSGGKGTNEQLSEAQVMKSYLLEKGLPDSAMILEDQSYSTVENLRNSKIIMEEHNYTNAIIVTHGFHALRASLLAESLGIPYTVEPVQISPINLKYYVLRECAGIAAFEVNDLIEKLLGTSDNNIRIG